MRDSFSSAMVVGNLAAESGSGSGAVSAPQMGCSFLGAAVSIRVQGGMRKRGMARWAGGQPRLEEKRQKPLNSFEEPSKIHRRPFVTSRLQHAYRTPAVRLQQAGHWLRVPEPDGGGLGSWRS